MTTPSADDSKVWFITGASKGLGYVWTEAALARGDRVAAAARNIGSLNKLKERYGDRFVPIDLDVGNKDLVDRAVEKACQHFGRIDIAVNNAGFGLFGAVEEVTEAEAREQIETNLFGALWVTQAVLPIMRARRFGRIIQISSVGGVVAVPTVGLYHASKWGLEGFSEALAAEVQVLGIRVTIVEPGGFATDWATASARRAKQISAYDGARASLYATQSAASQGDPAATANAILRLVDADDPPLRLILGEGGFNMIRRVYEERLALWERWQPLSREAQGGTALGGQDVP
jgi:NAD(P)-dependent dehydrogenase (short-subunit alcohol dehydrogenase family)